MKMVIGSGSAMSSRKSQCPSRPTASISSMVSVRILASARDLGRRERPHQRHAIFGVLGRIGVDRRIERFLLDRHRREGGVDARGAPPARRLEQHLMVGDETGAPAIARAPVDAESDLVAQADQGVVGIGRAFVTRVVEEVEVDHPGRIDMGGDISPAVPASPVIDLLLRPLFSASSGAITRLASIRPASEPFPAYIAIT